MLNQRFFEHLHPTPTSYGKSLWIHITFGNSIGMQHKFLMLNYTKDLMLRASNNKMKGRLVETSWDADASQLTSENKSQ
jgi:hypothetical protein